MTFCFALGVTKHNTGVKISNKIYYVQTAKVVNLKMVVVKEGSNFVQGEEFLFVFQILIF